MEPRRSHAFGAMGSMGPGRTSIERPPLALRMPRVIVARDARIERVTRDYDVPRRRGRPVGIAREQFCHRRMRLEDTWRGQRVEGGQEHRAHFGTGRAARRVLRRVAAAWHETGLRPHLAHAAIVRRAAVF